MAVASVILVDPELGLQPRNLARNPARGVAPRRWSAVPVWG